MSLASKVTNQTLDENDSYIIGSGEKAKIRIWNSKVMSEILPLGEKKDFSITKKGVLLKEQKVSHILVCGADEEEDKNDESLIIFQDDMLSLCKFKGSKNKVESMPICSNQHEILDMVMIGEKHLVAATMSPVIKIYNLGAKCLFVFLLLFPQNERKMYEFCSVCIFYEESVFTFQVLNDKTHNYVKKIIVNFKVWTF